MVIYYTNEFKNTKGESHRLLAKAVGLKLSEELGEKVADEKIDALIENMTIGELGKPEIACIEDFSISHSRELWAVLFDENPCGLDVQEHRIVNYDMIAKRWYREDEYELVKQANENEVANIFYAIWARREALVKSVGTSIVNSNLPSTCNARPDLLLHVVQFEGQMWQIMDITIPGSKDMSAAVCCRNISEIEFVDIGGIDAK